ncbi:hypothetical protein BGW42_005839 [Actinomortierella wolfii]|nr:hypothetical protein BGW42_005839 [Actinomortierella wolfii]
MTEQYGFGVKAPGFGGQFLDTAIGFQFAGYVDSWFNLAVTYPMKETIADVENLPRKCTSDGHFCFDIYEGVCLFGFASQTKSRACPLLKVIEFTTTM